MKTTIKAGAFVQAHFADENCLVNIDGTPAIECVLGKLANTITQNVVVAPEDENNLVFKSIAEKYNAHFFMGDKENVAKRFYDAARKYGVDLIVRVPAVKPFFDEQLMRIMLADFIENYDKIDFLRVPYTFYQNFAVEIYKTSALARVLSRGNDINKIYRYKPHYFMDQHSDDFRVRVFKDTPKYSEKQKEAVKQAFRNFNYECSHSERPGQLDDDFFPSVFEVSQRYEFFRDHVLRADTLLDIACGNGFGTRAFNHAREVTGVDYDERAVALANQQFSSPNLKYMVGDANSFVQDNSFSRIISFETIEHIECREKFVGNLYRSLKPGGTLIISTPIRKESGMTGFAHHLYEYSIEEFRALLLGHRFEITEEYGQDYRGFVVAELNEESRGMIFVAEKQC